MRESELSRVNACDVEQLLCKSTRLELVPNINCEIPSEPQHVLEQGELTLSQTTLFVLVRQMAVDKMLKYEALYEFLDIVISEQSLI